METTEKEFGTGIARLKRKMDEFKQCYPLGMVIWGVLEPNGNSQVRLYRSGRRNEESLQFLHREFKVSRAR